MLKIYTSYILICLVILGNIQAQIQNLEPILVSANEYQNRLRETGRNISVMTWEDIKRLPVNSIDDLLKFMPGIEIQQRGPQGSQSDMIIRGGTFQQVLVVIDGIRMNEPLTGHFNSYIPISLEEIERVEVIKGAAVAMFGPDAIGGVISITTKTFSQNFQKKKKEIVVGSQIGQFKLNNGRAYFAGGNKKYYLSASTQYNKAEGPVLRGTTQFFNNQISSVAFSSELKQGWKMMFRGSLDKRDFNAQNFYTTFLSDTATENVKSYWQQFSLHHKKENSTFVFMAGARQLHDIYRFRPTVTPNDNKSSILNIDMRNSSKFNWQQAKFTWGSQLFTKFIRSNDRGNHKHTHIGTYINLQHQPIKGIFITEALRADWDESYKWVLSPQLNMALVGKKSGLRASISKGIRDADFTERFNNYNKSFVSGGSIGNPELKSERSLNMEVGGDLFVSEKLQVSATWFNRNQNGLIDWVITSYQNMPRKVNLNPTGTYSLASNIASVKTSGIEIDLNGISHTNDNILIFWKTGITYLKSLTPSGSNPSFYLSSHARMLWNASAGISGKKGSFSITSHYKKRNILNAPNINATISPEYLIFNLRSEVYFINGRIALQIQADNLFNKSYSDLLGSVMPGRWLQIGVKFSLKQ